MRWDGGTAATGDPAAFIRSQAGEMAGLTVTRPTLEDVYLALTGAKP